MKNWKNNFTKKPDPITPGCTRMIVDIPNEFLYKLKEHKIPFQWAMKFFMDSFFQSMDERDKENARIASEKNAEETKESEATK